MELETHLYVDHGIKEEFVVPEDLEEVLHMTDDIFEGQNIAEPVVQDDFKQELEELEGYQVKDEFRIAPLVQDQVEYFERPSHQYLNNASYNGQRDESESLFYQEKPNTQLTKQIWSSKESHSNTQSDLDLFQALHEYQLPYQCELCCKTFALKSNLTKHLDAHKNGDLSNEESNEINCEYKMTCNIGYEGVTSVVTENEKLEANGNKRKKQKEKSPLATQSKMTRSCVQERQAVKCNICKKVFPSKNQLVIHEKVHSKEHSCDKCKENFKNKASLKAHRSICGKSHANNHRSSQNLIKNYVNKTGRRNARKQINNVENKNSKMPENVVSKTRNNYKCKLCSKIFKLSSNLVNHLKAHVTKENKIKGDTSKSIKANSVTKQKLRITDNNNDEKLSLDIDNNQSNVCDKTNNFSCDICNKNFKSKLHLATHKRIHNLKSHSCRKCKEEFTSPSNLLKHKQKCFETMKKNRIFSCDICPEQFFQKCHLIQHETKHSCRQCKVKFADNSELIKHRLSCKMQDTSSKSKAFTCKDCPEGFSNKTKLVFHRYRKHNKLIFKCEICNVNFKQKTSLIRHRSTHNKEKPYFCKICNKEFSSSWSLKVHILKHASAKPFQCNICYKQYATKFNFQNHMRLHISGRLTDSGWRVDKNLFKCHLCDMKFNFKSDFFIHLSSHFDYNEDSLKTVESNHYEGILKSSEDIVGPNKDVTQVNETKFEIEVTGESIKNEPIEIVFKDNGIKNESQKLRCDTCKNNFDNMSRLNQHYACDICLTNFSQKYNLIRHLRNHEKGKIYSCNLCEQRFLRQCDLRDHKLLHSNLKSYYCPKCGEKFDTIIMLNEHKTKCVKKKKTCKICKKTFRKSAVLQRHVKRHIDASYKTYTCNVCHKSFTCNYNLVRHARIHNSFAPFSCNFCDKCCKTEKELNSHINIKHGKKVVCESCGLKFDTKMKLNNHKRYKCLDKEKEIFFTCDICDTDFSSKRGLARHMEMHNGQKAIVCNICNKRFRDNSGLAVHLKTHYHGLKSITAKPEE